MVTSIVLGRLIFIPQRRTSRRRAAGWLAVRTGIARSHGSLGIVSSFQVIRPENGDGIKPNAGRSQDDMP